LYLIGIRSLENQGFKIDFLDAYPARRGDDLKDGNVTFFLDILAGWLSLWAR